MNSKVVLNRETGKEGERERQTEREKGEEEEDGQKYGSLTSIYNNRVSSTSNVSFEHTLDKSTSR